MRRAARPSALGGAALLLAALGASPGARAEGEPWALEVPAQLEVRTGAVAQVKVVLRGVGRHRVASSGVLVEVESRTPGLSLRQRRYQRSDAAEGEAASAGEVTFSIPVRGESAGAHALAVHARFWVCTPRLCLPVDQQRVVAVEVTAPPAEPVAEPPVPAPPPAQSPATPGKKPPARAKAGTAGPAAPPAVPARPARPAQ